VSEEEGIRVNDKRRLDPDTFEVRQPSSDLATNPSPSLASSWKLKRSSSKVK